MPSTPSVPRLVEGKLQFDFPNDWQVTKFDQWSFYRNQFQKLSDIDIYCDKCKIYYKAGIKAVDIIAIQPKVCCWHIEIKDYREHKRSKVGDWADEVALKVRDTLAAIPAAAANANEPEEKSLAQAAIVCPKLRVVLHLEQPLLNSKLFRRAIDPAKVQQRLRQLIKAVDPHPRVVEMGSSPPVPWTTSANGVYPVRAGTPPRDQ